MGYFFFFQILHLFNKYLLGTYYGLYTMPTNKQKHKQNKGF